MKRFWMVSVLFLMVASLAGAQTVSKDVRAKRSDEILKKLRSLDLLNQILPVVMTKDQIKEILPELEKAQIAVTKTEEVEFEDLTKLEKKLDPALKEAYEKGAVASGQILTDYAKTFAKLNLRRNLVSRANAQNVLEKMKTVLNKGQLAAARNALTPNLIDPSVDPKKLTDDEKLLFYVKYILLDPLALPILAKLAH